MTQALNDEKLNTCKQNTENLIKEHGGKEILKGKGTCRSILIWKRKMHRFGSTDKLASGLLAPNQYGT